MSAAASTVPSFVRLEASLASLVLDLRGNVASILYWGERLAAATEPESLAALAVRATAPGSPSREPTLPLTPLVAVGFVGPVGLAGHREGRAWAPAPRLVAVEQPTAHAVRLVAFDAINELRLIHSLALD